MDLGWKLLIPLALGWVLLIAALDIFDDRGFGSGPAQILIAAICSSRHIGLWRLAHDRHPQRTKEKRARR